MSITAPPHPGDTSTQSPTEKVRAELKAWEKSFAAANEGRKAGREDIKKNPEIAEKYGLYNKLRSLLSGTTSTASPSTALQTQGSSSPSHAGVSKKRKRPSADADNEPPHIHTTKHSRQRPPPPQPPKHPAALDPYDPPTIHLTPNPPRTFIGPTPQKNGFVMGLFDMLSPRSGGTPSKSKSISNLNSASKAKNADLLATPSKPRSGAVNAVGTPGKNDTVHSPASLRKLPTSATTAGEFITPSARRTLRLKNTPTSSRVSRLKFTSDETPEFLRRTAPLLPSFMAAVNAKKSQSQDADVDGEEAEISWSPVAVRLPRKPAGRCLSALVKGLRNMEEEKLDEDLDLLREMECEEFGIPIPKPVGSRGGVSISNKPRVQVQDSQVPDHAYSGGQGDGEVEMPLGADGEREGDESSESDAEQLGRDGRKLRVWKKRGQKRSTRRVVMRPTAGKWKPEEKWACVEEEEGEGVVRDTQAGAVEKARDGEGNGECLDGEDGEDGDGDGGHGDDTAAKDGAKGTVGTVGKKAKVKAPKKVSATAHANFRALKIRNKQSKGKKGGRFGRRNK
ncbi:DNA replication regulator sld2 [Trapelia coarctata]|nr:DNA replication regulator sld2 [Trapelia coarctata]